MGRMERARRVAGLSATPRVRLARKDTAVPEKVALTLKTEGEVRSSPSLTPCPTIPTSSRSSSAR